MIKYLFLYIIYIQKENIHKKDGLNEEAVLKGNFQKKNNQNVIFLSRRIISKILISSSYKKCSAEYYPKERWDNL